MDKVPPPKPKRTRGAQARQKTTMRYESLPTAPPVMYGRSVDNIFQFPSVPARARNQSASPNPTRRDDLPACSNFSGVQGKHSCFFCQPYREDRDTIEPLKSRLNSAIEAMDQLNRTYALLEDILEQKLATITDEEEAQEDTHSDSTTKETTPTPEDTKSPEVRTPTARSTPVTTPVKPTISDTEFELEHSLTLLESLMGTEVVPIQITKQGKFKRIRERSKSMMEDEINMYLSKDRSLKSSSTRPYLLRRQSTYSDNKSKVSKWTKVKAAFKWERANVPPPNANEPGVLLPINNEVERYLKVPIKVPCGSSSADSIISSSSGHFMSDTGGTPGTLSSASSMDDLDGSCRHSMRRDSSKSEPRADSRISNFELSAVELRKSATDERLDTAKSMPLTPTKSSSNKSLRRSKAFSDFEVLPEDHVADIKATTSRRTKPPPSPLNLNQVSPDLPMYSPLKSPKDGITQTMARIRHVYSPGNSSVPSSPSRHSDFFGEFESEDLSSGDFSEPTTPNHMEFKLKQRELERSSASNRSVSLRGGKKSSEDNSPTQVLHNELMATAQLEENLTPEFKKKLHKWRAKQNASCYPTSEPATSPTMKSQSTECKPKIDWNLWSTGQMKLEGQGLCALPEQKDLPEKFQKKLEQWNKLKSTPGGAISDNDSLKRGSKHSQSARRGSDDDRWYKHKSHDKEKLARLKAIVAPDHTSKKIEVKTSAGEVMKFEGISRKFTRKLYEWEKARGIGPEASTFALLHPGYCPIDVRRINKDCNKVTADHSPTLSRSLSLDSVAPSVTLPMLSQQASSLSLNDVNELKEIEDSTDALTDHDPEFKKYDEPEAVMVEVEEHIHDTASPLVTAHTLVEQQTPIYKYEEVQCNDYCNSRRVQSFESHTNLAPLLGALKRADELFTHFRQVSPDIFEHLAMRECQATLLSIRSIYPYYSNNLMKASVLNAISDVQSELGRLTELNLKSPLDEACCQETMEERTHEYIEELHGLHESLECLKLSIQGGINRYPRELVPDINITSEDGLESYATCDNSSRDQFFKPIEAPGEQSAASPMEHETETSTTAYRGSTGNSQNNGAKKKLRLRKMGSRQNSKTESDSSDADTQSVLETPRRLRRKNFRTKQRSLDDDFRVKPEDPTPHAPKPIPTPMPPQNPPDEVIFTSLKVKPGEPIEQCQSIGTMQKAVITEPPKISGFVPPPLPERHTLSLNANSNVFVKTKRKLITTIMKPNAEFVAVIEKELDSPTHSVEESSKVETTAPAKPSRAERPRHLSLFKSVSLERLNSNGNHEDLRKCQSSDNMRIKTLFRLPLARDSIRALYKSLTKRDHLPKSSSTSSALTAPPRKAHLYKKNSLHKSHSATVSTKIEHKIAKTNSGSAVGAAPAKTQFTSEPLMLPNKTDNTLPRIQRKLEGKTLTPTKAKQFEFPPTLEVNRALLGAAERPVTPLSERALRLQQARAQFLQSAPVTPRQEKELRPTSLTITPYDIGVLHKSVSAGTINTEPLTVEVSTDQESIGTSAYDSLPRTVSRSGKISSKLGFATIASKLRRVKGGGKKQKETSGSALSALCRQTLMADVIAVPQALGSSERSSPNAAPAAGASAAPSRNVHKSRSSPQPAGRSYDYHTSHEGLNKSLSEQYVRQLKESDV